MNVGKATYGLSCGFMIWFYHVRDYHRIIFDYLGLSSSCIAVGCWKPRILINLRRFQVVGSIDADGQTFLKLANGDGWVFSKGIAGKWVGKTIAEPLSATQEGPDNSNEAFEFRETVKRI